MTSTRSRPTPPQPPKKPTPPVHPAVEQPGETIMRPFVAPPDAQPLAPPVSTAPLAVRQRMNTEQGRAIPRNRPAFSWAAVGGTIAAPTLLPDEWVGPPWPSTEFDDNGARLIPGSRILVGWVKGRPVPVSGSGRGGVQPPPPVPITLVAPFTVPALTASATAATVDSREFAVGQWVFIQGAPGSAGFWGMCVANDGVSVLTLRNDGSPGNDLPGTVIPAGNAVTHGGPEGKGQTYGITTAAFTVPALQGQGPLAVDETQPFTTGQWVYVQNTGWFRVMNIAALAAGTLTVQNEGSPGNLPPGSVAPVGAVVTGGGPKGDPGTGFTRLAAPWAVPPVGTNTVATVEDSTGFGLGQWVYVEGGGWFALVGLPDGVSLDLLNSPPDPNSNQPPGTGCVVGAIVNGAGPQGAGGIPEASPLTAAFTVPALQATAVASVQDARGFLPGQWCYIQGAGWFLCQTNTVAMPPPPVVTPGDLTLLNDDSPGNQVPTTVVPVGTMVNGSGPEGRASTGATWLAADLTMPAIGASVVQPVVSAAGFIRFQWAYVEAFGWFVVEQRDLTAGANTLTLRNDNSPGNAAPGSVSPGPVPGPASVVTGGGPSGPQGIPSASPLTAPFTVPAIGQTAVASLLDARGFALGQWAYIPGAAPPEKGWFVVTATTVPQPPAEVATPGDLTLRNDDSPGNSLAGVVFPTGNLVTPGGPTGKGLNGYSYLALDFAVPAIGATATATIIDNPAPFAVGQWVFVGSVGWFSVTAVVGNVLTLLNNDSVGNQPPTTVAVAGGMVTGGGPSGFNSWAYLTVAFTVPAVGTTAVATMEEARSFAVGQWVYIQGAGWFVAQAVDPVANTITCLNEETVGNQAPGTIAPILSIVTGGGPKGDPGRPSFTRLTADFAMPAALADGTANVEDAEPFAVGQVVYVEAIGYLRVTLSDGLAPGVLTLNNLNYTVNEPPTTVALTGDIVTGTGPQGPPGYTWLAAAFTMPAVGATAVATVRDDPPPFSIGQWVHIEPVGWLMVTLRGPGPTVTLRNDASPGNAAAGTVAVIDTIVTVGGPMGVAYSELTAQFTMPAVGATVQATVLDARPFGVDSFVFVEGAGYFELAAKDNAARTLDLVNRGIVETAAAGDIIPVGARVITGGAPGIDGLGWSRLAADFAMPAVGATGLAIVERAGAYMAGQWCYIEPIGWLWVEAVDVANSELTLRNDDSPGNAVAGTNATTGTVVNGAGPKGDDGYSETTADFTMPTVGATVTVSVERAHPFSPSSFVHVEDAGYFECANADMAANTLDLINRGAVENVAAGDVIPSGSRVVTGGPPGVDGIPSATTLTAQFAMPAVKALGDALVEDVRSFIVGQWVFVGTLGWFSLETITPDAAPAVSGTFSLMNQGSPGNVAETTVAPIGTAVNGAGPEGQMGWTYLAAGFTIPGVGATSDAQVEHANGFAVGQWVYMPNGGYFTVTAKNNALDVLTLRNDDAPGTNTPGLIVAAGELVNGAGPGLEGIPAASPLTAAWTSPAVGATADASVEDARGYIAGQWCYVEGAGPYYCVGVTMTGAKTGDLTLRNDNQPGHVVGAVAPIGALVNGAGPAGVAGAGATPLAADWAVPAVGQFSIATVFNGDGFGIGQWVYVQRGGYFVVLGIGGPPGQPGANSTELRLLNRGTPGNSAPGTNCPLGMAVTYAGPPGPPGGGYTRLTAAFTVPAIGTNALASVEIAEGFAAGQWAFIEATGWFSVLAVDAVNNTLDLSNLGSAGNQPPATVAPIDSIVNGSGPGGLPGVGYTRLSAEFTVPAVGQPAIATCDSNAGFGLGQWVFIEQAGWYTLSSIPADSVSLELTNTGAPGNASAGATAPIGAMVNGAGPQGQSGGFTITTADFVFPAVNASATVQVGNTAGFAVGQWAYFEGGGWLKLTAVGVGTMSGTNDGSPTNATGVTVPAGANVTGAGPSGKPAQVTYLSTNTIVPPVGSATVFTTIDPCPFGIGQLVHVSGQDPTRGMYGTVHSINPTDPRLWACTNWGHRENGAPNDPLPAGAICNGSGPTGPTGLPVTVLTANFIMPDVGQTADATVEWPTLFTSSQFAFIQDMGYFEVQAVSGASVTLVNRGFAENAPPGETAPAGRWIGNSGPIGPEGATFSKLTQTFVMPAVGQNQNAPVEDDRFYAAGMGVFIDPLGYLLVVSVAAGANTLVLQNAGLPTNAPMGDAANVGTPVVPTMLTPLAVPLGTRLTAQEAMPAWGASVVADVENTVGYSVGMVVHLEPWGYLTVTAIDAVARTLTLTNNVTTENYIPLGGLAGQVLEKRTDADLDTQWDWALPAAGGYGAMLRQTILNDPKGWQPTVAGNNHEGSAWDVTRCNMTTDSWWHIFNYSGAVSAKVTLMTDNGGGGSEVLSFQFVSSYGNQRVIVLGDSQKGDHLAQYALAGEAFYVRVSGGATRLYVAAMSEAESMAGHRFGSFMLLHPPTQASPPTNPVAWPPEVGSVDYLTDAEGDAQYAAISHNHDAAYDGRYVNITGDTMSGLLQANGGIMLNGTWINCQAGGNGWRLRDPTDGSNRLEIVSQDNSAWADAAVKNWQNLSVAALKENIEPLDQVRALAAFDALRPVSFDWKQPDTNDPPGQFGFIVDDMRKEPALQSLLRGDDAYVPDQIIPILVAKIRALEAELDELHAHTRNPRAPRRTRK